MIEKMYSSIYLSQLIPSFRKMTINNVNRYNSCEYEYYYTVSCL